METVITNVQIQLITPQKDLIGFASIIINDVISLNSIAIWKVSPDSYRITYPTKKSGQKEPEVFYPIKKDLSDYILSEIINRLKGL